MVGSRKVHSPMVDSGEYPSHSKQTCIQDSPSPSPTKQSPAGSFNSPTPHSLLPAPTERLCAHHGHHTTRRMQMTQTPPWRPHTTRQFFTHSFTHTPFYTPFFLYTTAPVH
ncbi:hypothetical protein B484DRAFT_448485 [Ochromonadaceae sp. CCMP2298]|nr:hypothetical protein B484DRAFT_448485 [Ochromonadaceae sp. CCMP2298]